MYLLQLDRLMACWMSFDENADGHREPSKHQIEDLPSHQRKKHQLVSRDIPGNTVTKTICIQN